MYVEKLSLKLSNFTRQLTLPGTNDDERDEVDDDEHEDRVLPALRPRTAHHERQTHACLQVDKSLWHGKVEQQTHLS